MHRAKLHFFSKVIAAAIIAAAPLMASTALAKTLRIAAQADAGTLDPQAQNINTTISLLSMIYEPLVTRDKSMQKVPDLATSWEQTNATTWRFHLRQGVKFQDGTPFTADDVAFTIKRAQSATSQFTDNVAGMTVDIVDPMTVDIVTSRPDPLVPDKLLYIPIMSKVWSEANNATQPQNLKDKQETYTALHANGTGPYKLVSREPDSKTVLDRVANYWGKMDDSIDEVIFTPIGNAPTRVSALLSKQVDLLIDVPAQDVARLQKTPGIRTESVPEFRTIFYGFDLKNDKLKYGNTGDKNPFKDIRVRQAINLAIDRDAVVRSAMRGQASTTTQILAPNNVGYDPALDHAVDFDLAKAKKLLADAGYPDGFEVTLDCPNDRYVNDEQVCKTIVTMLAKIGVKLDLNSMPRAQYFPKIWNRDTSMFMMGFNSPYFDGMYALETMLMTRDDKKGEGIYNYEDLSDPKLDAAIAAARDELDLTKRAEMVKALYKTATDQAYFVSVYNQVLVYAMSDKVEVPVRPDNQLEIRWVRMAN